MPAVNAHTLEEHRDYLYETVKLKLFFVHRWLEEHPGEEFRKVIRERVDIYRKTDANPGSLVPEELFFDSEAWLAMEDAALEIYRENKDDCAGFERQAFEVFRASLDRRCERDYLDESALAAYQCGSLRYEEPAPGSDRMVFHIANAVSPKSIFSDLSYLPECFFRLLDAAEKIYNVKNVFTVTWLNSFDKWLRLFPEQWHENMSRPLTDVQWHYGYWGQFISARHTFNAAYGEIMRKTGRFPFYPRSSYCSVKSLREHLQHFLNRS